MVKAIFFDASDTLIYVSKGVAWHYAHVARRHGLTLDESRLGTAFREVWSRMPVRPATGAPRPDDDRGWWRDLVERVLTRCATGDRPWSFDVLFAELYDHFTLPGVWELYPEVRPALEMLHGRFALGVISNFDGRLRTVLRQLGALDFFDTLAISSEIGADKPHAFIFDEALRRLGVAPDQAVHVGDDPVNDWQGAAAVGMRCFKLERGKNSLADLPGWVATAGATLRCGS